MTSLDRYTATASDPTRFTDKSGYHDAPQQMAWMLTLERLLADALSLLAEPQASDLHRVQTAFDLLDKAAQLLGYEGKETTNGFMDLLRRKRALPRLIDSYDSLPGPLAERLGSQATTLYDDLYAKVRENTVQYRLTPSGAKVARSDPANLTAVDNDTLVATMVRAVRNTSHGLLELLSNDRERFLLAINTGDIAAELPALAPLIALGLFADADGLVNGSWKRKLKASKNGGGPQPCESVGSSVA